MLVTFVFVCIVMLFIACILALNDMCCYHPLSVSDRHNPIVVRQVPCGKCIGCLQDYQNSWKIRLTDELKHYDYKGVYVTLTYAPEFAHDTGNVDEFCKFTPFDIKHDRHRVLTVWKSDVQGWLKRCRRRMSYHKGENVDFKYFITSEYGPNTLRPHYHCLFIGLDVKDFEMYFLSDWSLPFIMKFYSKQDKKQTRFFDGCKYWRYVPNRFMKGSVDYEAIVFDAGKSPEACCDYVSKYCSKGFFENPRVARGDVEPTFHLCSKGIGYSSISDYRKVILQDYKDCSIEVTKEDFDKCREVFGFENDKEISKDYYYGLLTNYDVRYHEKEPTYFQSSIRHDESKIQSWYNTIFCLAPCLSFMREVASRAFIVRTYDKIVEGKKETKLIKYKLPRYYYDKIFPQDSAVRKAMSDVLQLLSDEKLSRELGQLRSEWPNETDTQIYNRYLVRKKNKNSRAESEAILYVRKRYGKSIL